MKTVWDKLDEQSTKELFVFNDDYRAFLDRAKTEREFVREAAALAEEYGYRDLRTVEGPLTCGDKVYAVNRGKNICLFLIGEEPVSAGLNIIGAHIDSPRIDLKQHPLFEKDGIALLDTHYYGGIKKYQWVARPLALHGVVCLKDGTTVPIVIGEDENDPVVGISDLLIHLSQEQLKKPASKVIEGESLDITAGTIPQPETEKEAVKAQILKLLREMYGIEEDDFISAEIEAVPAGKARDYGLDRSMIMGYGHDDRVCGYTSLRAILDVGSTRRTACCILVDKEEVGSVGATGMQSSFFRDTVARMLAMEGKTGIVDLADALSASKMLSSDVSAAYDPLYPEVMEPRNSCYFGGGIVFNKFTGRGGKSGSNDASPEFIAEVRAAMEKEDVMFQTAELGKVDAGGGGTIAYILANMNMDVMDAGIAVQNMHAPYEVVSKADVYEGYRAYQAFLRNIG